MNESRRGIPVAYRVDVVVVGGSSGAVAAAVGAAERGVKVFLAAPRPYLGEDICATRRLWLEQGEEPAAPLAKMLFSEGSPARPMHIKRTLDEALLEAGVEFLFGCYATGLLRGADGNPAGIVMANRGGRQAVVAKVVIDATDRAHVARMAGARFGPWPGGNQTFRRVVIGGEAKSGPGLTARKLPFNAEVPQGKDREPSAVPVFEYTLGIPMADGSFASFAEAEQVARDMTFHPDQADASEVLFQVPPDPMKGAGAVCGEWQGAAKLELGAFRPSGVARLFVLGGSADVPRSVAERLVRPPALIEMGARIGEAAADEAQALAEPTGVRLSGGKAEPVVAGEVREVLVGVRPTQKLPTIPDEDAGLPVLGEYDVVVVGGGTSGAPASIAAARRGARTLVVEYLYGLGGVETMGLINRYYFGYRGGFTAEIDRGVGVDEKGNSSIVGRMEWYRRRLREAGAEVWFGALGCGAFVEGGRVKGVVVATPAGRGIVLAKVVIDSTGSADIAAAAGAPCRYTDGSHVAVQGAGLPPRQLGANYTNTDYAFVDETDMVDAWHLLVYAKRKFEGAYDLGQLLDTRERRRIVGDFFLSPLDIINQRTYPDTVVLAQSNFDSHGFTVHPMFTLKPPDKAQLRAYVPYRCLLPKGLDGILVTGLAVSAHRDAMPIVRMQPDIQNEGYAAGVAAAMAAEENKGTREIDLEALQRHLVRIGNLPESVLADEDSYPLPEAAVAAAVKSVADDCAGLAVVLGQPARALPLLRQAYAAARTDEAKLIYAHVLGMMGDATGLETLIAAVERATDLDKGWDYRGMGQFGPSMSRLDSLLVAIGLTRDRRALAPILAKLKLLDSGTAFSHHRAAALALEAIGDPAAARPLAEVLEKPGMMGYATTTLDEARGQVGSGTTETKPRNDSLRELVLARALYRCGDFGGLGEKVLERYARDLRGHYARHAHAVLREGRQRKPK